MQKESQSGVYATRALVKVPIVDAFSHPGCPSLGTASKRFAGGIRFPSNCTLQFEFMQHVLFRWTQHSASLANGTNLSPGDGANLSPGDGTNFNFLRGDVDTNHGSLPEHGPIQNSGTEGLFGQRTPSFCVPSVGQIVSGTNKAFLEETSVHICYIYIYIYVYTK